MRGDSVDLRPLTLAELLDRSFSTYKQHLWLFVGIMCVPSAVSIVSAILLELFRSQITPAAAPERMVAVGLLFMLAFLVLNTIGLLVYAFALGAATVAVAQLYKDRATTIADAYRAVRPHAGRLIFLLFWCWLRLFLLIVGFVAVAAAIATGLEVAGARILSVVIVIAAFVVAMALCVYLITRWGVSVPVVVLENLPARASLRRSVELTQDHRGRVFLVILCAAVITYATVLLFQIPFLVGATLVGPTTPIAVGLRVVGAVVGGIASMFSGPVMVIGLAMMYYDLRIRKEALDLQMMLESLDTPRS